MNVSASARPRRLRLLFRRSQTRGGLKGGLPLCGSNALALDNGRRLTATVGKMMSEPDVWKKPKHVSGHVAMEEQSSHGFALCGQQSMSSMAATSVISARS